MRRCLWVALLAAALSSGCGDDTCGDCTDLFFVQLGSEQFDFGLWRVVVLLEDERRVECEAELPRREDARQPACTSADVVLTLGPGDTLDSLTILGNPERVRVVVELDGAQVGSETFEPRYEGVRPGDDCPIRCRQASDSLTVRSGAL